MKNRKGLIAIIVICIASFATTIALGIACISTFFTHLENGRIERAWNEFAERYHLDGYFNLPYHVDDDSLDSMRPVLQPDAENKIDLSIIPPGNSLEIDCGNIRVNVQSGDTAQAQLVFAHGSSSADPGAYRFELLQDRSDDGQYLLVFDFLKLPTLTAQLNVQLNVTLPQARINRLDISSDNGLVSLIGIGCDFLDVETDNGTITAKEIAAKHDIELIADNGSIVLNSPGKAANFICDAKNGSIQLNAGDFDDYAITASADNGRIVNNLVTPAAQVHKDNLYYERPGEDSRAETGVFLQADNGRIELNP